MSKIASFKILNQSDRTVGFVIGNREFNIDSGRSHTTNAEIGQVLKYRPKNAAFTRDYQVVDGKDVIFIEPK